MVNSLNEWMEKFRSGKRGKARKSSYIEQPGLLGLSLELHALAEVVDESYMQPPLTSAAQTRPAIMPK